MKNLTKTHDVFEFKEEDEASEVEANRFCSKVCEGMDKFTFVGNVARGTNQSSKDIVDEPCIYVDATERDFNGNGAHSGLDDCTAERMVVLDKVPTTNLSSQRLYSDRESNKLTGSFLADLDGCSSPVTASQGFHAGFPSDESNGTISDVDESTSEKSASFSSGTPDNHDTFDGSLSSHHFDHLEMGNDGPIVFHPDYLCYRGTSYVGTDTTVTFSDGCIEVKGSAVCGNSETLNISFGIQDIIQIQSQLSGRFDVAEFKIHVMPRCTAQADNFRETSGTEELLFAVSDFDFSEKCEAIESWNCFKALWKTHSEMDERGEDLHGEASNQPTKKYFPSYDKPFEEVVYPKGDPDAVCISKRDFDLLEPDTFINDTIIDFYIKYLKNGIQLEKRQRYHFFNSFFFRKLADMDKDPSSAFDGHAAFLRVRKWTRKVNLFEKDFVLIPINYNYHWSLIVICHPGEVANFEDDAAMSSVKVPCILHMDSLRGSHAGLKGLLQSYLLEEWKEREKESSEVVCSKFLNLRFVSLELPQQQNLSDCGLFLLHYVERFLEEDPAAISPCRIKNYHNEFLSINWFQPHEPSIKRSAIQRLISDLLQNCSRETSPSCESDKCYPEDCLKSTNDKENAVELVSEPDNLSCPQANGMTPFHASSSRGVCASDSDLVLRGNFEPESNEEQLLDVHFDHSASFNMLHSSLPPIEEEVKAGDHLVCTSTETGFQHFGGNGSESYAFPYPSMGLTSETSWIPGASVVQVVDEEMNPSLTTISCDTENPLDADAGERCEVDGNRRSDEKIDDPRSASANNIDLVDARSSDDELADIALAHCPVEMLFHNDKSDPVTSCHDNLCGTSHQNDIHENGTLACKRFLLTDNDSGSETDLQHNAKKMRLDEGEVGFRSSFSQDLHL